jgi:hypothetical protein
MSKFIGNNQYSGLSVEDRFWQKVNKKSSDECWEWLGATHHQWGYGNLTIDGKYMAAHRYSWELHNREIPDGMLVCHHCDNPSCVNPNHLFLGTNADNMRDRDKKNRQARLIGTNNGRAILNEDDIKQIFKLRNTSNYTVKEIADMFNISKSAIEAIIYKRNWTFVEISNGN